METVGAMKTSKITYAPHVNAVTSGTDNYVEKEGKSKTPLILSEFIDNSISAVLRQQRRIATAAADAAAAPEAAAAAAPVANGRNAGKGLVAAPPPPPPLSPRAPSAHDAAASANANAIKIYLVHKETSKSVGRLEHIYILDWGDGMTKEILERWAVYSDDTLAKSDRGRTDATDTAAKASGLQTFAIGELSHFGRGSKQAGFELGGKLIAVSRSDETIRAAERMAARVGETAAAAELAAAEEKAARDAAGAAAAGGSGGALLAKALAAAKAAKTKLTDAAAWADSAKREVVVRAARRRGRRSRVTR